jgi:hypothetical protein
VAGTGDEAQAARPGRARRRQGAGQIGGQGKGGGIALVQSPDAAGARPRMLAESFVGTPHARVLVRRLVDIQGEFYCAITLDRASRRYLAMVSSWRDEHRGHRATIDAIAGCRSIRCSG